MIVSKQVVAEQIARYLRHEVSVDQLVDWAETTLMEAEFDERNAADIAAVVARLGVADVRTFGLTWNDCEALLGRLGFAARVEIVAA